MLLTDTDVEFQTNSDFLTHLKNDNAKMLTASDSKKISNSSDPGKLQK